MRITMLAASVGNPFGQERVLGLSVQALAALGHEVNIITDRRIESVRGAVETHAIAGMSSIQPFTKTATVNNMRRDLEHSLDRFRPDLIHFIDFLDERILETAAKTAPVVLTAHTVAPTCPASTRQSRKVVCCERTSGFSCLIGHYQHGCLSYLKSDLHRAHAIYGFLRRKKSFQKHVQKVFAISGFVKECLLNDGWDAEKVQWVPNPVEHLSVASPTNKKNGQMLLTSRLTDLKGVDTVLHAVRKLKTPHSLIVCGDGPERQGLENQARELELKNVLFLGSQPFERVKKLMLESSIYVQANRGPEAFGMALAEAMSAGCACVVTNVPALGEVMGNATNGLVVERNNPEKLAATLEKLLQDSKLSAQLGRSAQMHIQRHFSIESHIRETLAGYTNVCTVSASPSRHRLVAT
jgi:glycosyltransferase involved in cell wall biosynthesis